MNGYRKLARTVLYTYHVLKDEKEALAKMTSLMIDVDVTAEKFGLTGFKMITITADAWLSLGTLCPFFGGSEGSRAQGAKTSALFFIRRSQQNDEEVSGP